MVTREEIEEQKALLAAHRETLTIYLRRLARLGGIAQAPPEVIRGIEEAQKNISRIKSILRSWNISIEDHPNDTMDIFVDIQGDGKKPVFKSIRALVGFSVDLSHAMQRSLQFEDDQQLQKIEIFRHSLEYIANQVADRVRESQRSDTIREVDIFAYAHGLRNLHRNICNLFSLIQIADQILRNRDLDRITQQRTKEVEDRYHNLKTFGDAISSLIPILRPTVSQIETEIRQTEAPRIAARVMADAKDLVERQLGMTDELILPVEKVVPLWERSQDVLDNSREFLFGQPALGENLMTISTRFAAQIPFLPQETIPLLFIFSGGEEDNPQFERAVQELAQQKVIVISCFIQPDGVAREDMRTLFCQPRSSWSNFERQLFEIATEPHPEFQPYIVGHLFQNGWTIEPGARLFLRVFHPQILKEFIDAVLNPLNLRQ